MVLLSVTILACLVPFWYSCGQGCSYLQLPSITGYILSGILCGPHVSAMLRQYMLDNLAFVEHACLSYIALLAGAELHLGGIKRIRRQVTWMVGGISFFSYALVFTCALLAAPRTPFLASIPRNQVVSVCNLLAVLALARSPASAISVIHEVKGSGPYCSLVMAIVIVKDVLVFLAFSLALNAAEQASMRSTATYSLSTAVLPFISVASSLALGTLGGILFQKCQSRFASSSTPIQLHTYLRGSIPLIISSSVYYISDTIHAEPLLACVAAGATATFIFTASHSSSSSSSSHSQYQADQLKLHASPSPMPRIQRQRSVTLAATGEETTSSPPNSNQMTALLVPISTILFGLVGANLHVDKLLGNSHLAAMLFAARIVGIWIGSWVGGAIGAVPAPFRQRVPFGMVTQAGIAMGLTRIVVARCKICPWGPDFEALMAAIIVGNLILGPLLFKSAIVAAGEATGVPPSNSLAVAPALGTIGAGSVPMMTPIKSYQMEEGFITPLKAAVRPEHGDEYQYSTPNGNTSSFVPIIHLSPSSPSAKLAL